MPDCIWHRMARHCMAALCAPPHMHAHAKREALNRGAWQASRQASGCIPHGVWLQSAWASVAHTFLQAVCGCFHMLTCNAGWIATRPPPVAVARLALAG
eukprot:352249-Chlamydomonas_euryale.AAC.2